MVVDGLTAAEAARLLRSGQLSSAELTASCFAQADRLDGELGVYLARFDEAASEAAAAADADFAAGIDKGHLQGIPVGIKDVLACSEGPTSAQSLVLDPAWGAGRDAPVISRLRRAGAVITGKVTTMEFAIGLPDPAKPFPVPRNPWAPERWPGGSSSGSAIGVATGIFLIALGTDTGGSIRTPAAMCGVSGLKPTYGRVPKSGCVPRGFTLDHVGPLGRSADDCGRTLGIIEGRHASDPTSTSQGLPYCVPRAGGSLDGLRVGIARVHHQPVGSDPAIEGCLTAVLRVLADLGASIREVEIPLYEEVTIAALICSNCEAFAYHRKDLQNRWTDYFESTRRGVAQGALVSAADYVQAQRVRRVGQRQLAQLFENVDVIVTPTVAVGAPAHDDLTTILGKVFTPYWDGVGNPVLAVPMGFTSRGLPLSAQIAGRPFEDSLVLRVGHAFQEQTRWHLSVPPIASVVPRSGPPA